MIVPRPKHVKRHRALRITSWVLGLVLLLTGGSAFAAYRYDRATVGRILPGVSVAGVDLGGMSRAQAISALEDAADRALDGEIDVRAGDQTWHVTPRELGATADVIAQVDRALSLSERYTWPARVLRRLLDRPVGHRAELQVTHDPAQVDRFVGVVEDAVFISPVNAAVALKKGKVKLTRPQEGRRLQADEARAALLSTLDQGSSSVDLPVEAKEPRVTGKKLGYTIVVSIAQNKLYLYKGLKEKKVYRVATGTPGYPTPRGAWTIWHKAVNPTWINPAPNGWGAGMPRSIPGGPNGPLGTRALYLDAPGIRIHGTPNASSIGTAASHGCIRMLMPEVEELYEIVPIDTKVLII